MKKQTMFDEVIDLKLWREVITGMVQVHGDLECGFGPALDVIEEQIEDGVKIMRFEELFELIQQRRDAIMDMLVAKFPPDRN